MEMKFKYYTLIIILNIHRNFYSNFYIIIITATNPQGPPIHNAYSRLVPMLILNWNSKRHFFKPLSQTYDFSAFDYQFKSSSANILFLSVEQTQWSFN